MFTLLCGSRLLDWRNFVIISLVECILMVSLPQYLWYPLPSMHYCIFTKLLQIVHFSCIAKEEICTSARLWGFKVISLLLCSEF